jgi:hypothetical protein
MVAISGITFTIFLRIKFALFYQKKERMSKKPYSSFFRPIRRVNHSRPFGPFVSFTDGVFSVETQLGVDYASLLSIW